jgi:uncharacterized membrane-anchored protein YjiN (DUF445 family)
VSTKTTKPKISEESRRKLDQLATTKNLYQQYDEYILKQSNVGDRAKERLAKQISSLGSEFIADQEREEQLKRENKAKEEKLHKEYASKVELIVKESGSKNGSLEKLNTMTYEEIDSIYIRVLDESQKGFWSKLFDFLMG